MASNASIVVNDGASTPLAHTFDPAGIKDGNVAVYQNKSAPTFSARETVQLKMKSSAKVRTVTTDLRIPRVITETVNGVSVSRVVDFATFRAEVIVPLEWTAAQAKNARILGSNLLAHSTVGLMAEEGEFVW